jgi:hypothetical protein
MPAPEPHGLPSRVRLRARHEGRRRASRWRFRAGSRRGRVWATRGEVGRLRREAGALPGSVGRHRPLPGPRTPLSRLRPRHVSRGDGQHPSDPRCRSPAPRQSGVARKGDAAGSSRRSRSQALTALAASRLQYLAASGRRHTNAKPMGLAPVFLLGLVRPLDGRLSETLITSGALRGTVRPDGVAPRVYQGGGRPPPDHAGEMSATWRARSGCDRGRALLDSAGCSGSGSSSIRLTRPPGHQRPCIYPLLCTSCG